MFKEENISILRDDENPIMILRRHWIILILHILYISILVITTTFIFLYRENIMSITGGAVFWGSISLFWIVFLTFIFFNWIHDELDFLIITDTRIVSIKQMSALSRSLNECSLEKVQEVNAQTRGILETIFGFWEIHIRTASETSNIVIKYAVDPIENARRINNIINEYHNSKSQNQTPKSEKETL
jgi:uncharacterized membrane protein YdbT with pleckstrin-like domain